MEAELLLALSELAQGEWCGFAEIEQCRNALGVDRATILELLGSLEEGGLVDMSCALLGVVRLTEAGRATVERCLDPSAGGGPAVAVVRDAEMPFPRSWLGS
ncbi:MAG TPA: hypothetical protein VFG43_10305 [Geminicoccaceae bacterium]|nr:hypothetical protein [Geminicoccaceae bacterium]